ncbi:MAG TPA: hypothetical protein VH000_11395 [Rhizomicrobium sp.]|jgi:hypothetical protein|nr:hypothetical protein [Rhizomicrobium sp.]
MKSILTGVCAAICAVLMSASAHAGPEYDFVLTSVSLPGSSVVGFIQFDSGGYSWSDVTSASLVVNGDETLSLYVGGFQCGSYICQTGCNPEIVCQQLSFEFSPNGKYGNSYIMDAGFSDTLWLGTDAGNGDGTFLSDSPYTGCNDDAKPCLFTGYWQLDPLSVPEPGSAWLLASAFVAVSCCGLSGLKRKPKRA